MTRFQVYLDHPQLEILDYFANKLNVPRSRALRSIIDAAGGKIAKKLKARNKSFAYNPLLEMCGKATGLPINLSETVDDIYLKD